MKRNQITKVSKATSSSVTTTIQSNLTYDPNYRVTAIDQYYNGSSTASHVVAYTYCEAFLGSGMDISLSYGVSIDFFGSRNAAGGFTWIGFGLGEPGIGGCFGSSNTTIIWQWQFLNRFQHELLQ